MELEFYFLEDGVDAVFLVFLVLPTKDTKTP